MNDILRCYKGLAFVVLVVVIIATVLVSCQPAAEDPRTDSNPAVVEEPQTYSNPAAPEEPQPEPETIVETSPPYTGTTNYSAPLTPIEKLGITGVAQDVYIAEYRLTVDGLVENPLSLTYQDILDYPSITEIGVINCTGFFLDIAEWTGVPMTTILTEAGVKSDATQVTFYAIDGYRQTVSLEHVDKYDLFLAYKVNGQTLPPEHGYPLRVVDNGSVGYAWVKWLEIIQVE